MKFKVRPEDFRVEELLRLRFVNRGRYSIYRLEKRNWSTLSVLKHIERKYRLGRLSRAGLKDRYSCSVQYVSAEGRGPGRIEKENFTLKHIGFSTRPVTRDLLLGNRFGITVRDLTRDDVALAQGNLTKVRADGFPNYHDDQRFGSARPGEGFIARKLVQGDLEGALRLYMAKPAASDDEESRRSAELIDRLWGDWALCLKHAKPEFSPVLYHLKKAPADFEGALRRIERDLLELFVTSFQSWLWNETLAALIKEFKLPFHSVPYAQGELLFFTELSPEARRFFQSHEIPVVSPRAGLGPEPIAKAIRMVLARERLKPADLRLPVRIEGLFFKPYTRAGLVRPHGLSLSRPEPDELHKGKLKLELAFELPPGSFATILVRRLLLV